MKTTLAALLLAAAPMVLAQERAIVKTVTVKAPVEEAWKAWTTAEGIRTFFAPDARVEARPGGPFEIYFNPYGKPGTKGADGMVFLAVQDLKVRQGSAQRLQQRRHCGGRLVRRDAGALKVLAYLALLAALGVMVVNFPILWELAIAGAIGGAYWFFFRQPPGGDAPA